MAADVLIGIDDSPTWEYSGTGVSPPCELKYPLMRSKVRYSIGDILLINIERFTEGGGRGYVVSSISNPFRICRKMR